MSLVAYDDSEEQVRYKELAEGLEGGAIDNLYQMVKHGPRDPGEVPAKGCMVDLVNAGLAVQVIGKEGYLWAATPNAKGVYDVIFPDDPIW